MFKALRWNFALPQMEEEEGIFQQDDAPPYFNNTDETAPNTKFLGRLVRSGPIPWTLGHQV